MTSTTKNSTETEVAVATSQEKARATRRPNTTSRATDAGLVIRFEVPGATRESIEMSVEGGELRLSAATTLSDRVGTGRAAHIEFRATDFSGRWTLPDEITAQGAVTSLENGVLTLTLLRRETTRHTIEIG